jgi:hypothetical protein
MLPTLSGPKFQKLPLEAAREDQLVWTISTIGFTSVRAFLPTLMTFGLDRILFSPDHPFGDNEAGVDFLMPFRSLGRTARRSLMPMRIRSCQTASHRSASTASSVGVAVPAIFKAR